MQVIARVSLWEICFPRGCEPMVVPSDVCVVMMGGNMYLHTPHAFLNYHGEETDDETIIRQAGQGYYRTRDEAWDEIERRYPHWRLNQPIMSRLDDAVRWDGEVVGPNALADALDVSIFDIHEFARGKTRATRKQLKAADDYGGCPGRGY